MLQEPKRSCHYMMQHTSWCTHSNFTVNQLWFREHENYSSLMNQAVEKHPSFVYSQVPFIWCPLFLCSGCPHTGSSDQTTGRGCWDSQLDNYCFQACRVSLRSDDKHNGWHCWRLVQPTDHVHVYVGIYSHINLHALFDQHTQSLLNYVIPYIYKV